MANNTKKERQWSEKEVAYVRRLVYDAVVYTLPKCGFPEKELPPTNYEENVYKRENFVETVGISALRVSLLLRDKWKRMFESRHNNSGFSNIDLSIFIEKLIFCCPLSWADIRKSIVNESFALCVELILFFHHEGINVDLNTVINSASKHIMNELESYESISEKMEQLFDNFHNISAYTRWVIDFVTEFAIPYGSRENVSELFAERVKNQWREDVKNIPNRETLSMIKLRNDYIGYLPNDHFVSLMFDQTKDSTEKMESTPVCESALSSIPEPSDLTENKGLASESTLSDIPESTKPSELPAISESLGSQSTRSEDIPEQAAQSSSNQWRDDLTKLFNQETLSMIKLKDDNLGCLPNDHFVRAIFDQTEDTTKKKESESDLSGIPEPSDLTENKGLASESALLDIPESTGPSEMPTSAEYLVSRSTRSEDISEKAAQSKLSHKIFSEQCLADELRDMSLSTGGVSQETRSKKSKKSKKKK